MITIDLVDEDISLTEKPAHRRSDYRLDAHTVQQRTRDLLAYLAPVEMLRVAYAALVGKENERDLAD